jgi:hypothetical protein
MLPTILVEYQSVKIEVDLLAIVVESFVLLGDVATL